VVERCLRKDPRRRWLAIGDVRLTLEEPPGPEGAPDRGSVRSGISRWWLAAVDISALAALLLAAIHFRAQPESSFQASQPPPEKGGFIPASSAGGGYSYDVTQDGQRFISLARAEGASGEPLTLVTNWPARLQK
jgi:hypothetical protein